MKKLTSVSKVIKTSKKTVKAGKSVYSKIISAPKEVKRAVNNQREYLAKRRAFRRSLMKKNPKTVEKLKAKGFSYREIQNTLVALFGNGRNV